MAEQKKCTITKQDLLNDGWVETKEDPAIFCEKLLPNRNHINSTPEDSDIKLILHAMYNSTTFAVLLPCGGVLNFVANSIEELHAFERKINFYDPLY